MKKNKEEEIFGITEEELKESEEEVDDNVSGKSE